MSNINFLLDVNNTQRLTIRKTGMEDQIKDSIKAFKRGAMFHFDIKGLGLLQVDSVIPAWKQKALIIKATLLVDYAEMEEEDEVEMAHDAE